MTLVGDTSIMVTWRDRYFALVLKGFDSLSRFIAISLGGGLDRLEHLTCSILDDRSPTFSIHFVTSVKEATDWAKHVTSYLFTMMIRRKVY